MQKKIYFIKKILLRSFLGQTISFKKKNKAFDLIIYDDIYPHPSSGFRLEEFSYLLKHIENSKIILSGSAYNFFNLPIKKHNIHIKEFKKRNIDLSYKLEKISGTVNINCKLFYCVFLHNIYRHLEIIEENKIPFVFTLYPGGGFVTESIGVLDQLKKIFSSKYFKKVIVTQKRTYHYLIENKLCQENDILFVFGVVVPQSSLLDDIQQKKYYLKDKQSFDICFCATKYTKYGEDKGYPLFVDFIKAITPKHPDIKFHIIGGFDETLIDVSTIQDRITFYGYQDFAQLKKIFNSIDLIVSPNQPGKLQKGAFDGFPLGTVIEAALNGVVVMLTDCFAENKYFEDGKDLVIIKPDLQHMLEKFDYLISDINNFYQIAKRGREKFIHLYSNNFQMKPRIELLKLIIQRENFFEC